MNQLPKDYRKTIQLLKKSIIESRYIAAKLVNKHLLELYHFIGGIISSKAIEANWGEKILDKISEDLQNEMPGLRGFSPQNLKKMRQFFEAYQVQFGSALPNQIREDFWNIGFTHHYLIISKTNSLDERYFYIHETSKNAWSSRMLEYHLKSDLFHQQGTLQSNFTYTLPVDKQAISQFKDEYLLDYINIEESEDERVIENEIVLNIKKFLMSLGTGFTFIGNQYRIMVEGDEFYIDLLFFNRQIQALVAIELKRGKFKPEYAGQLNFYLNVLDDQLRLPYENPSIGIILCKEKSNTVVKYAIGNIKSPMGVATFKTASELPESYRNVMPKTEELKKLLSE